jgi:hypothetical protein
MDSLVHRLKELDQITFQQLCFHLMVEKYPSARIRYVEGASGDEGLDIFCGDLTLGPTIWQCKSFQITVIGKSQKDQIRESLRNAVKSSSPKLWVLCLNMDFDTKAHRWFKRLQDSYAKKRILMELVQGSDIVHELMFRHTLRDHYFPNSSVLDEVRKLLPRSSVLTEPELESIPGEAVEDYIARLRERDPRFIYEITVGGDRGAAAFPPPPEPGIVSAVTDGRKTVKAFVRDPEALLLDPIGFSLTLTKSGVEKMLAAIRTGRSQQFEPEEILEFKGNFPLLSYFKPVPGEFGIALGSVPTKPVPLRLSFLGKDEQVVYELLEFEITRAGTDEVEISTNNKDMPFRIQFVFPVPIGRSTKVGVNVKKRFLGSDAIQARKGLMVFRILKAGCNVELFSLQQEKKLAVIEAPPVEFDIPVGPATWIEKLARVSEYFRVSIRLPGPEQVHEADFDSLNFLYALATGEDLPINSVEVTLVKSEQNSNMFPNLLRNPTSVALVHPEVTFQLVGTEVRFGYAVQLEKAEVNDPDRALLQFQNAQIGEGVLLSIRSLERAKVFRVAGH